MKYTPKITAPNGVDESRRWFMSGAVGLGAAGVGLATLGAQAAEPGAPEIAEKPLETPHAGYHETDHIRRYYRSAG